VRGGKASTTGRRALEWRAAPAREGWTRKPDEPSRAGARGSRHGPRAQAPPPGGGGSATRTRRPAVAVGALTRMRADRDAERARVGASARMTRMRAGELVRMRGDRGAERRDGPGHPPGGGPRLTRIRWSTDSGRRWSHRSTDSGRCCHRCTDSGRRWCHRSTDSGRRWCHRSTDSERWWSRERLDARVERERERERESGSKRSLDPL
jgi:hypothetical protein